MSPRADKGLGALRAKGNFQCADNHWYGLCCIEATGEAEVLDHRSELDWLFVLDDDVYVNRKNLAAALAKVDANDAAVWGIPGCGSCPHGSHGLCGGGGYAVSRANLDRLADQGKEAFRAKFLEFAKGVAANWSDVSFGCVSQYHSLALKQLDGLYGWSLEPAEMAKAVESKSPLPLTFHYMKPEQMRAVHGMFEAAGAGGGSSQASSELQVAETDGAAMDAYASQRAEYVRWQNSIRSTDRV